MDVKQKGQSHGQSFAPERRTVQYYSALIIYYLIMCRQLICSHDLIVMCHANVMNFHLLLCTVRVQDTVTVKISHFYILTVYTQIQIGSRYPLTYTSDIKLRKVWCLTNYKTPHKKYVHMCTMYESHEILTKLSAVILLYSMSSIDKYCTLQEESEKATLLGHIHHTHVQNLIAANWHLHYHTSPKH